MDKFGGKICNFFSILTSNCNICHYFLEFWGGENSSDILLPASLREHRLQDGQGSESEAGECGGGPEGRTETPPPQDATGRTDPHLSPLREGRVWGQNEKSDKKLKFNKLTSISYLWRPCLRSKRRIWQEMQVWQPYQNLSLVCEGLLWGHAERKNGTRQKSRIIGKLSCCFLLAVVKYCNRENRGREPGQRTRNFSPVSMDTSHAPTG